MDKIKRTGYKAGSRRGAFGKAVLFTLVAICLIAVGYFAAGYLL